MRLCGQGGSIERLVGVLIAALLFGAVIAALLVVFAVDAKAGPASEKFVTGDSTQPVDFDEVQRCEGGANDGKTCTGGGDCTGGACVAAWRQIVGTIVPSWAVRETGTRTCTGSFIALKGSAVAPCWLLRLRPTGPGAASWRYAGESGAGITLDVGTTSPTIAPPSSLDCNGVEVLCANGETVEWWTP